MEPTLNNFLQLMSFLLSISIAGIFGGVGGRASPAHVASCSNCPLLHSKIIIFVYTLMIAMQTPYLLRG
jgi:hypothetical protein